MNLKALLSLLALILIQSIVSAQPVQKKDTAYVNRILQESKSLIKDDTSKAISLANQAIQTSEQINYPIGHAYALKNLGLVYYTQGKYVETLDYWTRSLKIFEEQKNNIGISNLLNNIAAVYFDQGVDDKALEYSLKSLTLAEQTKDDLRILSALTTVGAIYHNKKNPVAINYLLKALPLCESTGNTETYVVVAGNLGEIYFDSNNDAKALEFYNKSIRSDTSSSTSAFSYNGIGKIYLKEGGYENAMKSHEKALAISQKLDDKLQIIRSLRGLGDVYAALKNQAQAFSYYNKATAMAESIKANVELKELYNTAAGLYAINGDYQNAFRSQKKYSDIKDTLYNSETAQKLSELQFDFDLQKKQGEIDLLTKDKSLQDSELKKQIFRRNALLTGLILVFIIAFILARNYRQKVKINQVLDKQKEEIEGLLLNILPAEVAKELQLNGHAKSRNYENVTVLFADFIGFTTIADKLSPEELVEELNSCFLAFDNIIEKYNIEKIKTIGDSYMCAGGIPVVSEGHAHQLIKASLEIQEYITANNIKREEAGLVPWLLRIGIHAGPVVAGVVGKKKYAYDIWGSTVNIASRMESNGSAGRVNISESTYRMVKDSFNCTYRGKIYAKNLGEIDMYFVEGEIAAV